MEICVSSSLAPIFLSSFFIDHCLKRQRWKPWWLGVKGQVTYCSSEKRQRSPSGIGFSPLLTVEEGIKDEGPRFFSDVACFLSGKMKAGDVVHEDRSSFRQHHLNHLSTLPFLYPFFWGSSPVNCIIASPFQFPVKDHSDHRLCQSCRFPIPLS